MIGAWARVEGSRCDPNPNDQFARPDGESLFRKDGKLTPSITILGETELVCCITRSLKMGLVCLLLVVQVAKNEMWAS